LRLKDKTVYYEPAGRIHPSQWELINYPPAGYKFITGNNSVNKAVVNNSFVFDKLRLQVLDRLMPLNLTKAWLDSQLNKKIDADLIYAYNHIVFREIPWIVNVEWAHILVGRDLRYFNLCKRLIEKALSSVYCRKILTWTETAKQSILLNYDCVGFANKIEVVPPAVHSKNTTKDYSSGRVKILFLGSPSDPNDFKFKGGQEVIQTFIQLNNKYNNLELAIRAKVPQQTMASLVRFKNIRLISKCLSPGALGTVYENSDIFLFPSHKYHNITVLEAMSYGLPVVTTEIGASGGEYVDNGVTGFVVPSSKSLPYFIENYILTSETIHRDRLIKEATPDPDVVNELVSKTSLLVENPALRKQMGEAAKRTIDYGRLSIKTRNEALKRIFDKAI